jgi:uncharacterized coiled-coil protein SlyX
LKIKTLNSFIKSIKRDLDEKRKSLQALYEKQDALFNKAKEAKDNLEQEVKTAQKLKSTYDNRYIDEYLPTFKSNMEKHIKDLENQAKKYDPEIEKINDQIAEFFREMKKYEIVKDRIINDEQKEAVKKRQEELDEIALQKFISNKKES